MDNAHFPVPHSFSQGLAFFFHGGLAFIAWPYPDGVARSLDVPSGGGGPGGPALAGAHAHGHEAPERRELGIEMPRQGQ